MRSRRPLPRRQRRRPLPLQPPIPATSSRKSWSRAFALRCRAHWTQSATPICRSNPWRPRTSARCRTRMWPNRCSACPASRSIKYYIEPQLAYFTNDNDDRKDIGASFGVAAKITDSITSNLNWFYSREQDTSLSYTDKVWFNGQGTAAGFLLPGIDPTQPYSIGGNGVVQNATFNANGAETATLYQQNTSIANNFQWKTKFNNRG